jgi:hypothetical protein
VGQSGSLMDGENGQSTEKAVRGGSGHTFVLEHPITIHGQSNQPED